MVLLTMPVLRSGAVLGMIRIGSVRGRPVNAAACTRCGAAVFDLPSARRVARWLRDHLANEHDLTGLEVDTCHAHMTVRILRSPISWPAHDKLVSVPGLGHR